MDRQNELKKTLIKHGLFKLECVKCNMHKNLVMDKVLLIKYSL